MARSPVPPPGVYVPLVTFFKEDEEFDEEAHRKHVLRLAEVRTW
jgi:dihydrodipicolinate synthase/N-acetylneuraminate lyase